MVSAERGAVIINPLYTVYKTITDLNSGWYVFKATVLFWVGWGLINSPYRPRGMMLY